MLTQVFSDQRLSAKMHISVTRMIYDRFPICQLQGKKKEEKNQKSLGLGWEMILVTVKGKTTVDYWNLETAVSRPKPPNSVRKLPRDN